MNGVSIVTNPTNNFLAVYGTLMEGMSNHGVIKGRAKLIAPKVKIKGALYAVGGNGFPCFVSDEKKYPNETITAEVWEVTDPSAWEALDYLEGYDKNDPGRSMYIRRPIQINESGKEFFEGQAVNIYEWNGPITHLKYIATGDWKEYVSF